MFFLYIFAAYIKKIMEFKLDSIEATYSRDNDGTTEIVHIKWSEGKVVHATDNTPIDQSDYDKIYTDFMARMNFGGEINVA